MRSLDVILGQAEAAVERRDWDSVADAARRVLAVDDANEDALAFLSMALPGLDVAPPRATVPQPPAERATPLLVAIEDELRTHPGGYDAARGSAVALAPLAVAVAAPAPAHALAAPVTTDREAAPAPLRTITPTPSGAAILAPAATGAGTALERPVTPVSDAISTPRSTWSVLARRRHLILVRTARAPRRVLAVSARGPLLLTAGIITATIALTSMGATRDEAMPLAARVVESASTPVPAAALAAPAPAPVSLPSTTTAPPEPVVSIAPPVVVAAPPPPPPVVVPAARRYQGTFRGSMGRIVAVNGCEWDTPFEASVNATLSPTSDGSISGTAASLVQISYVVTNTPVGATCNPGLVSADASGPIIGGGSQLSGSFVGARELTISFVGTYSDEVLVGNATIQRSLSTMSTFGGTNVTKVSAPANLVLARS